MMMVVVTRETNRHNYTTQGVVKEATIGTYIQYNSSGDGWSSSENESTADHPPVSDNQLLSTHDHHDMAGRRSRQKDQAAPPHGDVGRQNDRGPSPDGEVGCQGDQGPPPHGEDGRQRDDCGDPGHETPLGSGGEGSSSSDDEDVADSLILGMNRHGVGKLETRFIGEFSDRVMGMSDGYLEAGGGMVQNVTVTGGYLDAEGGMVQNVTVTDGYLEAEGGMVQNVTVTGGYLEGEGGMVQNVTVDHSTGCGDRPAAVVMWSRM